MTKIRKYKAFSPQEAEYVIRQLGGTRATAQIFGIKDPSVSEWRKKGIPFRRRHVLFNEYRDQLPKLEDV